MEKKIIIQKYKSLKDECKKQQKIHLTSNINIPAVAVIFSEELANNSCIEKLYLDEEEMFRLIKKRSKRKNNR